MADAADLSRFVPGFEFLQGLMKNAGAAIPGMSQWIAPTLDPDELDKRIQELRTVQFWLEQNARLLGTTIQALEVQRMTLSTLRTMNLPLVDLKDALTIRPPAPQPAPEPAPVGTTEAEPDAEAAPRARKTTASAKASGTNGGPAAGPVDPMKWWGALTQQFTELAAQAVQSGVGAAAGTARSAAADSAPAGAAAGAKPQAAPAAKRRRAATKSARKPPARARGG